MNSPTTPVTLRLLGSFGMVSLAAYACAEGTALPILLGGTVSDGGGTTSATSAATGGAVATGGAPGTGGSPTTGGARASGGSVGVGGASTGGAPAVGKGGTVATGGTSVAPTGGSTSAVGGATSQGGTPGIGGSSGLAGGSSVATAGAGPDCVGALFCDDFEDGNTTGWDLSATSTVVLDTVTNHVLSTAAGPYSAIERATIAATDQYVEADIKVTSFPSNSTTYMAGLVARFSATGSGSFFFLAVDGANRLYLRRTSSSSVGSGSGCGTITLPAGTNVLAWNHYKIFVVGAPPITRVETHFNGVLQHNCTTTDTTYPTSGPAGVMAIGTGTTIMFDNFKVSTP